MQPRSPQETVERAYAEIPRTTDLCLLVAIAPYPAFAVALPSHGTVSVGRGPEAELCLGCPTLSRLHFAIETADGCASVRDLGSRNGTLLEGATVGRDAMPLPFGAEIISGDGRFSIVRRSNLPQGARPFELLGPFEATLLLQKPGLRPPAALAALELCGPLHEQRHALSLLAALPDDSMLGLASDDTVLIAASSRGVLQRSIDSLIAGAVLKRYAIMPFQADRPNGVAALLRDLKAASSAPAKENTDIPTLFRYPSLQKIHADLRRIAPRPISILITGETGTGKELLAREIHRLSKRTGPLVAVNTAALPEALIESELFGHERGAFSGAQSAKVGLIECADKGTLFLDEIGELPLPLQAKLLRVLEEQSVRRVGANTERKLDLRVVAATHQNLEALVRERRFRQDLLFRLNGAFIVLPPLRERRSEIPLLARQILIDLAGDAAPTLSDTALAALEAHEFPGNVRELRQILARALAFADGGVIELDHLPAALMEARNNRGDERPTQPDMRSTIRDFERERIEEALRQAGGNRTRAAEILGLPRRTLIYKLSKLRLSDE